MDPRKQKRLGPAPIASFEKSFEDNNPTTTTVANKFLYSVSKEAETETMDIYSNGSEMDHPSHASITTTATTAAALISSSSRRDTFLQQDQQKEQQQQQQQQPCLSVAAQSSTNLVSSAKTKPKDCGLKKRPHPLKATTTDEAAVATTTTALVNSDQPMTFRGATTLTAPTTPRIELSRASSSSHHEDSRDSSPENVFEQVGTGTLQEAAIGLGFREEGALELRSSTEELYFMDPEHQKEHDKMLQQQQQALQTAKRSSPIMFKFDEHQNYLQQHQRKDSASSEVAALLCISGRTSRISSVGSQASAMSHLSAVSGVSRSPSPHRMLLETSFCGPKPLENLVDGRLANAAEPPSAEILEQVLLARKSDPTQVVLAEGIRVEGSPQRNKRALSNGDSKATALVAMQNRISAPEDPPTKPTAGTSSRQGHSVKSPGQMVVGKTPSGTEYIRINLKPDHMYTDKGVAPNERIIEASDSRASVTGKSIVQKKPVSLSLGRTALDETRLTPVASPKSMRRSTLSKDVHGSRSPSPGNVPPSRKSSISSFFRVVGKDSPDSPRDRPRSKSKDRQTPQSLNATPSKQKSVLAIFKPSKRGSGAGVDSKSSKNTSPVDRHDCVQQSRTNMPPEGAAGSRPPSRLRYYEDPVEGFIHIPLHTPPEEKETRKLLQGIAQLNAEPIRPMAAPVTPGQLAAAAAALKPVGARKSSSSGPLGPKPQQGEKAQRIENLDAIQSVPSKEAESKERNWSLEVQRHSSSQDSQETLGSDAGGARALKNNTRLPASMLAKQLAQEISAVAAAKMHRVPLEESNAGAKSSKTIQTLALISTAAQQPNTVEDAIAKERRRLLFATRLGSGSEEQIFSTQFSISKTESQSSQLSVQNSLMGTDHLQRTDTIIRRPEEPSTKGTYEATAASRGPLKRFNSIEANSGRDKSLSTSEDEKTPQKTSTPSVILRRKGSPEESRRKSRSTSEDDVDGAVNSNLTNQRHSRYLENFDVRRKGNESVPRKPKRQSISEAGKTEVQALEETVKTARNENRKPILPQPPPPSTAPSPSPPPAAVPQSVPAGRSPTPTKAERRDRSKSESPIEKSSAQQTPTKPPRTTTPTQRSASPAVPSPQPTLKASVQPDRQSVHSTDEPIESSESERDSEVATSSSVVTAVDPKRRHLPHHVGTVEDHESTGLVSQESFEDELPYVPTTLPEERAQGVALIPMKERANMELKTCPVDRPRSITPLNPSHLEEYCGIVAAAATPTEPTFVASGTPMVRGEKLRISLPRKDATKERCQTTKSPRRTSNTSGKSWFEFAEEGLRAAGGNLERKDSNKQLVPQKTTAEEVVTTTPKPEKQPQAATKVSTKTTTRKLSGHWIDFENIPEKRKPAKRITALPKDGSQAAGADPTKSIRLIQGSIQFNSQRVPSDVTTALDGQLPQYNYVKPEDCQCECHEVERGESAAAEGDNTASLARVDLLQQGEDMLPLLDPDIQDGIEPSDSSRELSCYTDDEVDVPLRQGSLSRYRVSAMKTDEFPRRDGTRSPRNRKFPDHRY